jgi:hypothetical protein
MKTQNYIRNEKILLDALDRKVITVQNRILMYMYVNDFDTVELHLYSVHTLKLDSVKH